MSDLRAIRAAKNEDLFREVNERIKDMGAPEGQIEALCECTDPSCHKGVILSRSAYESVRADGTRFLVAPGHESPPIERIVERSERYWIIEKKEKAAQEA